MIDPLAPPRIREWWAVVKEEKELTGSWPNPFKMVAKLFNCRVGRAKWTYRMLTCSKCPVFDGELRRCRGPQTYEKKWLWYKDAIYAPTVPRIGDLRYGEWERGKLIPPSGCGCYVPFLAITKTPYTSADGKTTGCWGRATIGPGFGWE